MLGAKLYPDFLYPTYDTRAGASWQCNMTVYFTSSSCCAATTRNGHVLVLKVMSHAENISIREEMTMLWKKINKVV